ncbi:MAG: dihydrofolate reductase family protein [Sandaracinaceae bacterium]|nr:dihydrofolate reductase family protein [Sandaracinaceae bacterium]
MTREEVDARARALFGEALGPAEGVLHVVSSVREGGVHRAIRIGPRAPSSPTDGFVLALARARVDAILVSGAVLRAEPSLVYARPDEGLASIRGDRPPPWLCVLTARGELPATHPVWSSWARPIVITGPDAPLALDARVEVVRLSAPSARAALAHLVDARGCRSVSVEAGPRVAAPLYEPPCAIDELSLSTFEGALDARALGGALFDDATLAERMVLAGEARVDEASGPWRFARYVRRAPASSPDVG